MSRLELLGCVAFFVVGGLIVLYVLVVFTPPPAFPN
jgi:hypothetical protein